ncbi:cytochrome-c peroxidase [Paraburkholderia caballeronis]|uniref:cytochrome-c peroxidase n=1 Tax=Paraburkholderia caballeronis TaxID=416943 RepID=UPI0010657CEA|nr:cytochrome c peroxidase [Paraburkholderia caballeronis]TDV06977.1 cytochrome c peroxidase [Paraburkholderia caballeronis]TDV10956.1 cytochrome c peroxidase [Paraburkholderia caballeronis]TDV22394.1 cytochrome c peroxidase [Paraburkholderia caballeronis]
MIRDGFRPASRWTGIALAAALAAAAATAPLKAAQPGAAFAAANGAHAHPPAVAPVVAGGKPLQRWIRYPAVPAKLSAEAMLGKQIFFDPSLSASGKMSCASCHSPDHAYGPPNGLAVQLGGPDLHRPGTRTVPSLRYLTFTPLFTRHFYNPASEDTQDEGPTGGFMRDGSMASLHEQAARPMLDPNEMANTDPSVVVAKLAHGPYADTFRLVFGAEIFANPKQAFDRIGNALEAFETEDESFHPYTSKFDAVMSGHADFTAQELRGYALFNDPNKGNCAKCHIDTPGPGGRPAQFADFSYASLGVPRNPEVPATHDPKYFDLGLCGPYRRDLANETDFCGLFKSPTLRNAAARSVFFHNGRFHTLEDVMHFYVERDIAPQKWYPKRADGRIDQYDDLPPAYRDNIDHVDVPFDRGAGSKPALNEAEIRDVIAFMKTLNDGYSTTAGGPKVAAR